MKKTSVLIVGGGPLGITASALLSQYGIDSITVDMRDDLSNHPRARLYDSPSAELFRQLGVADEIDETGIGAKWTQYNRAFVDIKSGPIANLYSPEFHSVPRDITPQKPVMTCQDLLEPILLKAAEEHKSAEFHFSSEVYDVQQGESGCTARVRHLKTGEEFEVEADYIIGADGSRSEMRKLVGGELVGEVRQRWFRDILFHADLTPYVQSNMGGLLYVSHPDGVGLYQPLDGKNRWRCQVPTTDPNADDSEEYFVNWIKHTLGAGDEFTLEIESILRWQVTARVSTKFSNNRIHLIGDAAQVFTPTGGMGMNTAFTGLYNLAWKLAYVIKGVAPASILETYHEEYHPQATLRTQTCLENADFLGGIYRAYRRGEDLEQATRDCYQYAAYTGVTFGYEYSSSLVQEDPDLAPVVKHDKLNYAPIVRNGRRAPHIWIDQAANKSLYDWFGLDYVVALGATADKAEWSDAVDSLQAKGFPVRIEELPEQQYTPYDGEEVVIIRPDRIVAAHWADVTEPAVDLLAGCLPLV
ncbi:FAD-dependent monooxygenase [Maricurvus nonylphenolicus]|uniref:FAD-dependent monooxygenase n=1 Tax=Maricurvus nonylphenolicus TaxID=1008307 RepID=UPI0036F1D9F0